MKYDKTSMNFNPATLEYRFVWYKNGKPAKQEVISNIDFVVDTVCRSCLWFRAEKHQFDQRKLEKIGKELMPVSRCATCLSHPGVICNCGGPPHRIACPVGWELYWKVQGEK